MAKILRIPQSHGVQGTPVYFITLYFYKSNQPTRGHSLDRLPSLVLGTYKTKINKILPLRQVGRIGRFSFKLASMQIVENKQILQSI